MKNSLIISNDFTGDANRFHTFVTFIGMKFHSYGIKQPMYKAVLISADKIIPRLENGI